MPIETIIGVGGVIAFILYQRRINKIDRKVLAAQLILWECEEFDTGYVSRVMEQEMGAY